MCHCVSYFYLILTVILGHSSFQKSNLSLGKSILSKIHSYKVEAGIKIRVCLTPKPASFYHITQSAPEKANGSQKALPNFRTWPMSTELCILEDTYCLILFVRHLHFLLLSLCPRSLWQMHRPHHPDSIVCVCVTSSLNLLTWIIRANSCEILSDPDRVNSYSLLGSQFL